MQTYRPTSPSPTIEPLIQGDPATRKSGLFIFGAFGVITILVIVGIAAGNAAHYQYYGPHNATNISTDLLLINRILRENIIETRSHLLNERLKIFDSLRQTRSIKEEPSNKRR